MGWFAPKSRKYGKRAPPAPGAHAIAAPEPSQTGEEVKKDKPAPTPNLLNISAVSNDGTDIKACLDSARASGWIAEPVAEWQVIAGCLAEEPMATADGTADDNSDITPSTRTPDDFSSRTPTAAVAPPVADAAPDDTSAAVSDRSGEFADKRPRLGEDCTVNVYGNTSDDVQAKCCRDPCPPWVCIRDDDGKEDSVHETDSKDSPVEKGITVTASPPVPRNRPEHCSTNPVMSLSAARHANAKGPGLGEIVWKGCAPHCRRFCSAGSEAEFHTELGLA